MIFNLLSEPMLLVVWLVGIIYAITIHEFSHALAGYWLGDMTARDQKRLTLNPLSHIDPIGFIVLLFAGFGWGRPVPFNPYNLKFHRWGPVLVAMAGPISNVVSFLIFGFALRFLLMAEVIGPENLLTTFFIVLLNINLVLAVFNLIPVPPLDGSKLIRALAPPRFENAVFTLERYGPWVLLAIVIFGGNIFSGLFSTLFSWSLQIFG
ncbi:MAG: site-2 protease family protein [Candidatus Kerfeldbacteria bacterium]|nr:site-2 protease family protein [Candidatus Kerfeldbacteria bacterium]